MSHYRYVKVEPVVLRIPLFPFVSFSLGISILVWVIWPLLSFQLFHSQSRGHVVTPLAEEIITSAFGSEQSPDISKANAWLPKNTTPNTDSPVESYAISIPKLRIHKAQVKIGTDDLSKSIIHFGSTGLPGKYGNSVLFGHSILPQFYDPKNYMSIFSLLPQLKENDEIFVHFDGIDYRYRVVAYRVTTPDDVTGLEQRYDDSYITLVTCVPPGTYLQRLWVTAKLIPFGVE